VFFGPQGLFFPILADLRQIVFSGRLGLGQDIIAPVAVIADRRIDLEPAGGKPSQ